MENEIKKMLIEIARGSIYSGIHNELIIDKEELVEKFPNLQKRAATFVTLNLDGELRGCVGSLVAHKSLIDDLTLNAFKAAFDDKRFSPLSKNEFERVEIEISLLSQPLEIKFLDLKDLENKIQKNIDGVIVRQGDKQATFLPQVWEQLPKFDDFLAHLFHKAGITDLDTPLEIFVYQVEKIR